MTNTKAGSLPTAPGTDAGPPATAACTRSFPGLPESVGAARSWVAGFLPGSPAADDAVLMTSELVTNAVVHSASGLPGGTFTVSVRAGDGSVRVDVTDQGEAPRRPPAPAGLGRGLFIVSQLADVFGADGADRWFFLRTDRCAGRCAMTGAPAARSTSVTPRRPRRLQAVPGGAP